ncbi:Gfo/Idh/MocA family protein [Rhodococcoides yunnanense]|uniref:Gfo/Idh/MocA family oxidoreductase n=1 Tax=Rhodococcoides yunnanense TaxID=278209 RepID=A0ABU4BIQ1_9NOCA|nr:Gfo/Idh/MocA family oxidoreductase [Rhodococcus yunnanensis]MDV6263949.1 Gfo/Idh/MocA family oxidoreductase [Rhodococcus yunnanensis]
MNTPIRIGVLGCADIAMRRMLPGFQSHKDVQIVAIASRSFSRAESAAERFGGLALQSYTELLDLVGLDAVYVPLPAALHGKWIEAALDAGKHVLAEKPMTMSAGYTEILLELARNRGLALMENAMFLHHPMHADVRRLLSDGAIGDFRNMHAAFTIPALNESNIRYQRELGGGALADVGYYPLRVAQYFLGPELEVVGAELTTRPGRAVETAGAALLRSDGGKIAQITFGMEHGYLSRYELCGSEGRIAVNRAFTPPAEFTPVVELHRDGVLQEIRLQPCDQVAATIAAFVESVRVGFAPSEETRQQAFLLDEVRRRAA